MSVSSCVAVVRSASLTRPLLRLAVVLTILMPIAGVPSDALASHNCDGGFGSYAKNTATCADWPHFVAASRTVNWGTNENNANHRNFFRPYWIIVIQDEYHVPTALNSVEVSSSDAYVF